MLDAKEARECAWCSNLFYKSTPFVPKRFCSAHCRDQAGKTLRWYYGDTPFITQKHLCDDWKCIQHLRETCGVFKFFKIAESAWKRREHYTQ